jgi:hypothetical protein
MTQPLDQDREFFVGYLPMPKALRQWVIAAAVLLTAAWLLAGYALADHTQGAGRGKFAFGASQGSLGLLTLEPVATLWTEDPAVPGGVRGTLLARQGKFGLNASARALDGHVVRVSGSTVERDGRRMLELSAQPQLADADLDEDARARLLARSAHSLGDVAVSGEIVDSKCYLGRMRPGDRRTHRACAQLCISGGIPALLVARDDHGVETAYQLATRDGRSIDQALLPYVAEPVLVRGELFQSGDQWVLRTDLESVTRL